MTRPCALYGSAQQLSDCPLPYTFEGLDRDGLDRSDPTAITAALNSHEAEILPVWRRRVLMSDDGDTLHSWPRDRLNESDPLVFLGLRDGTPYFAADISAHENPETEGARAQFIDPWMVGPTSTPSSPVSAPMPGICSPGTAAAGLRALRQPDRSRPCRAGTPLHNTDCGEVHFPRINPATIMLVQDPSGERCVMAAQSQLPADDPLDPRGYVDAGETLEQTVVREVAEEVGLRIGQARYAASQPWAFSNSLMIGFFAWSETEALQVNTEELERADWYSRDEINARRGSDSFRLPRRDSIARFMIESWMASDPEPL